MESSEKNLQNFGYEQSLNRVLGLGSLIFYGLAYLAPLTIFTTYGLITNMTHGMLALTYTVATIAMALTALSYSKMVKAYPIAGSAYSYAQRAINPHIGFLAGWAILMDYLLIPMINYLVAALFLQPVFPGVPSWVWIVIYIALVTVINLIGIQVTAWVNNGLVLIQFVFLLAFILFLMKWIGTGNGAGTFLDSNAYLNPAEFNQEGVGWGAILGGASILALSFLGFDAVTTVVEEAKDPARTVGRAIIITCLGAGAVFVMVSYLCQLSWPMGWSEYESVDTGAYELIARVAGSVMGYLFTAAYCIACLASAMASQASASRILFGMGRDGVLPKKFFSHINSRFHTPTYNILLIGVISLIALKLSLAAAASLINFGALIGFTLVNLSVIAHYFIRNHKRSGINILIYLILPALGAATTFTIWLNLDVHSKILGFSWLAVGVIYLAITTRFFTKLPPEMNLEE